MIFSLLLLERKGVRNRNILVKHYSKYSGSGRDFSKTESHDNSLTLSQWIFLNKNFYTFAFSAFSCLFFWDFLLTSSKVTLAWKLQCLPCNLKKDHFFRVSLLILFLSSWDRFWFCFCFISLVFGILLRESYGAVICFVLFFKCKIVFWSFRPKQKLMKITDLLHQFLKYQQC